MGWIILFVLIGFPLLELSILIEVGGDIGALSTIGLCILTAAVGLRLVKAQGMQVMARVQERTEQGEPIGIELVHGFFLLMAGIMLVFPGFVTDSFGILLLIPPVRQFLGTLGIARMAVKTRYQFHQQASHSSSHNPFDHASPFSSDDSVTIEADYVDITKESPKLGPNEDAEDKEGIK